MSKKDKKLLVPKWNSTVSKYRQEVEQSQLLNSKRLELREYFSKEKFFEDSM